MSFLNPSSILILIIYSFPILAFLFSIPNEFGIVKFSLIFLPLLFALNLFAHRKIKLDNYSKIFLVYFLYINILDLLRGEFLLYGYGYLLSMFFFLLLSQIKEESLRKYLSSKFLALIVVLSFAVIIVQAGISNTFFTPSSWQDRFYSNLGITDRLPSIYGFISATSPIMSFAPILSIVLADSIVKSRLKLFIIFSVMGIIFGFLTRGRANFIYVVLVVSQILFYRKSKNIKTAAYAFVVFMVPLLTFFILSYLEVPIGDIVFYRFLEGGSSLDSSTIFARISNFDFFVRNISEFWIFGAGTKFDVTLSLDMNRQSNSMLIGLIDPFFRHGIFAFSLYLLFLILTIKEFYLTARRTNNYGILLGFLGFVFVNITLNAPHIFQMGIMLLFLYNKYLKVEVQNDIAFTKS